MRKLKNDGSDLKSTFYVYAQLEILGEEQAYRAFAAIVREQAKKLKHTKVKIVIEDLVQEVIMRIAMNPEQFGANEDDFGACVFQCLFQRYINFCKKKGIVG